MSNASGGEGPPAPRRPASRNSDEQEQAMSLTSFAYRVDDDNGHHVRVSVFAGPDEQHRAHCGTLTFRPQEWADFQARALVDLAVMRENRAELADEIERLVPGSQVMRPDDGKWFVVT